VSFAAPQHAQGVAGASNGALTLAALRGHHWSSDLYDVDGGQHTTSHVVSIRFGRWSDADARRTPPGARRGVVFPDLTGPLVAMGGD
jgi:hypothetical protein